jgi:hypothetical protein
MRLIPLAICLALALGACGDGSADNASSKAEGRGDYSRAEREWLGKIGAWRAATDTALRTMLLANGDPEAEALIRSGDLEAVNGIRTALEVLKACSTTLTEQVGPAPTARLRKAVQATRAACPDLEAGATEDLRALDEDDPELLDAGDGFIELGAESLWAANEQVLARAEGRDLPRLEGASEKSRVNPALGPVADALADNLATATEVRCWSTDDWPDVLEELSAYWDTGTHGVLGFASPDLVRINLSPKICESLDELLYDRPEDLDEDHALAVLALTHEAMHVAWVDDEAEATCFGLQEVEETAVRIGLSKADAAALAELAWTDAYHELGDEYRSVECADGRSLDVNPETNEWP